jgi:hypothetical protein
MNLLCRNTEHRSLIKTYVHWLSLISLYYLYSADSSCIKCLDTGFELLIGFIVPIQLEITRDYNAAQITISHTSLLRLL